MAVANQRDARRAKIEKAAAHDAAQKARVAQLEAAAALKAKGLAAIAVADGQSAMRYGCPFRGRPSPHSAFA